MAWETRNHRTYYYRSHRIGARVHKEYIGAGFLGQSRADLDVSKRHLRNLEAAETRSFRQELESFETLLKLYGRNVEAQVSETLAAAGYHRPKRGVWRKRRMKTVKDETKSAPSTKAEKKVPDSAEVSHLLERFGKGDKTALGPLIEFMKKYPAWVAQTDLSVNAERALIKQITSQDGDLAKSILEVRQDQLRQELATLNPTPLESLLIRRVSLCWLQAYHADYLFAQHIHQGLMGTEYIQKYQDRANKRLLQAVKALAQVRRLGLPMVQVNIGERQVNVQAAAP
jgi:hypothetical protein